MDDTHEFTGSLYVTGSVNLGVGESAVQAVSVIRATETNSGIAIVPNGTGAFTLQVPDGTTAGGDARGAYAVDLQMDRSSSDQVAGTTYDVIAGGRRNKTNSIDGLSFIFAGILVYTLRKLTPVAKSSSESTSRDDEVCS